MNLLKKVFYWGLRRESVTATVDGRIRQQMPVSAVIPQGFLPLEGGLASDRVREFDQRQAPIAITARFRSGSTLLWRLLRDHPAVTAYYEPLNPRRWFDAEHRGTKVDKTHRGVCDYWSEYSGISPNSVRWDESWTSDDLYLSKLQPKHRLYDYIKLLLGQAQNRSVLQFNRLDFRLEWFKHRFPGVSLIHLQRNPRDQWLSTFQKHPPCSKNATIANRGFQDEFYLLSWARDLSRYIPLLAELDDLHPYELSYLIWRLSEVFAQNHVDYTLQYESLVKNPRQTIGELADRFGLIGLADMPAVESIDARSVKRWGSYADPDWFKTRESRCDRLLDLFVFSNFVAEDHYGSAPGDKIKTTSRTADCL